MGKRNKAAKKQKKAQAKSATKFNAKKKNEASIYGIAVSKGKHGKGQRQATNASSIFPSKGRGATNNPPQEGKKKSFLQSKKIQKMQSWKKPTKNRNLEKLQEDQDFANELASLRDRHYHEELKTKNIRQRQQRRNTTNANVQLTPATLQIKPKTTEDLINDTADIVADKLGMDENHRQAVMQQQQQQLQQTWGSNQLQILAAQKRLEWSAQGNRSNQGISDWGMEDEEDENHNDTKVDTSNPFSALVNGDDESDNENDTKKNDPPPVMFQFAPVSFQLPSSSNVANSGNNDFDDL